MAYHIILTKRHDNKKRNKRNNKNNNKQNNESKSLHNCNTNTTVILNNDTKIRLP